MDPGVIAIFIPILGIIGVFGLIGFGAWSKHKLKMRELSDGDDEGLIEVVQQLSDEVGSVREALAELHERVDFTERMLSEVKSGNAIRPGDST